MIGLRRGTSRRLIMEVNTLRLGLLRCQNRSGDLRQGLSQPPRPINQSRVTTRNQHRSPVEHQIHTLRKIGDRLLVWIKASLHFLQKLHKMRDEVRTAPMKDRDLEVGKSGQDQHEAIRRGRPADTTISRKCRRSIRKRTKVSSTLNPAF